MKNDVRPMARVSLLAIPLVLGAGLLVQQRSWADDQTKAVVYDYADKVTRLVESGKIKELSELQIPATDAKTTKLQAWTAAYVAEMQKQDAEREKQYNETVAKAQDFVKREKYDEAMDRVVQAYEITKDQEGFLKLDWVKDLTAKIAATAGELEKNGKWIESFQLYADLNSLYEIDTRYKPDYQRVGRRIRLLAMYTPKTLFELRKAVFAKLEKEKDEGATTAPTTAPAVEDPVSFPKWQEAAEEHQSRHG